MQIEKVIWCDNMIYKKKLEFLNFSNIFFFMFITGTMQQEICVMFSKTPLSGQLKKYIYVSVFFEHMNSRSYMWMI